MTPVEAEIALMNTVMNVAMQLYVADIQKTPKEDLHLIRPLSRAAADGYVGDALTMYEAAFPQVRPLIKRKT